MTSINVKENNIAAAQEERIYQQVRMNKLRAALRDEALTELDVSGIGFGAEGVPLVAKYISGNRALAIANVMGNGIGKEMLFKLQDMMRSKPNLVSLCGIADDATEADLSGLGMDADDAVILAFELPDKGALLSLNLSNNYLGQPSSLPEGWSEPNPGNPDYRFQHTDGRHQGTPPEGWSEPQRHDQLPQLGV